MKYICYINEKSMTNVDTKKSLKNGKGGDFFYCCREVINLSRANSDPSQTSHCNITGLSVREVMRIENRITKVEFLLIFQQLVPTTSVRHVCKHKRRICNLILGHKGLREPRLKI